MTCLNFFEIAIYLSFNRWKFIFLNQDIFKMTSIFIMWIDIKFCLILKILSSSFFELNSRKWKLNTRKNVSFTVCEFVDEFSFDFKRHSYAKRRSIKFWLKSLSINASIRTLFIEITKIINAHKWEFFFTRFRIVNTWIMSIDFCLFSIACRCRHYDIETCNVSTCHMCNKECEKDSSLNESFFDSNSQWRLSLIEFRFNIYF
jgi:hypothetical protein